MKVEGLTARDWKALQLSAEGKTDVEVYKIMHPNATDKVARGNAFNYFKAIQKKLNLMPHDDVQLIYGLSMRRFYQELNKRLEAETELTFQGAATGKKIADNSTRMKATELLAKVAGAKDKDIANNESNKLDEKREAIRTALQ